MPKKVMNVLRKHLISVRKRGSKLRNFEQRKNYAVETRKGYENDKVEAEERFENDEVEGEEENINIEGFQNVKVQNGKDIVEGVENKEEGVHVDEGTYVEIFEDYPGKEGKSLQQVHSTPMSVTNLSCHQTPETPSTPYIYNSYEVDEPFTSNIILKKKENRKSLTSPLNQTPLNQTPE